MSGRVREYLRTNLLGLLALFVALSAGAYAAGLPKNSVKSKQIKAGAVKESELAADSVTGEKVVDNSLTGADVDEGSLQLPAVQGPAGPEGPTGPQGPVGPASGPAGGDLTGNFPDPLIGTGAIDSSNVAPNSLGGPAIDEAGLDPTILQRRVGSSCAAGEAVRAVAQNGSVTCESSIAGPPTGAAAGDLAGNYPNPTIRASEALHYVGAAGEPAFRNGWANFGGAFASAAYYKDRTGIVHLRGLVNGGAFGEPFNTGTIFRIPSGSTYGPCGVSPAAANEADLVFATISNNAIGRITILDGPDVYVGAEAGSNWISLDGIEWRADGC
jgi:hypothetical protein